MVDKFCGGSHLFGSNVLTGDIIGRRQYDLVHIVQQINGRGFLCVADTFGRGHVIYGHVDVA